MEERIFRKTIRLTHMRRPFGYPALLHVPLLAALAGCGGGDSNLAHVEGVVRVNGQPLAAGRVVFQPMQAGLNALGRINPDGTFTLTTKETNGALIGEHKVAIIAAQAPAERPDPSAGLPPLKWLAPERYAAVGTSGLTCEVKAGDNYPEFDLKSP
jgi:hypothetical protein